MIWKGALQFFNDVSGLSLINFDTEEVSSWKLLQGFVDLMSNTDILQFNMLCEIRMSIFWICNEQYTIVRYIIDYLLKIKILKKCTIIINKCYLINASCFGGKPSKTRANKIEIWLENPLAASLPKRVSKKN